MFFLITACAAVVTTIVWHLHPHKGQYKLLTLCFIFWGATFMWLVDHVMAYLTEGKEFFEITLDATLLGISAVLLGLLVWLAILLIGDPKGMFNKLFLPKK